MEVSGNNRNIKYQVTTCSGLLPHVTGFHSGVILRAWVLVSSVIQFTELHTFQAPAIPSLGILLAIHKDTGDGNVATQTEPDKVHVGESYRSPSQMHE